MAGRTGFEPVLQAPEARVLSELDYRPIIQYVVGK